MTNPGGIHSQKSLTIKKCSSDILTGTVQYRTGTASKFAGLKLWCADLSAGKVHSASTEVSAMNLNSGTTESRMSSGVVKNAGFLSRMWFLYNPILHWT